MSHKLGLEQHFTLHEEHRPFSIPRRKPGQTVRCQSMEASTLAMHLPDVPLQDYHAPKFERDTRTRVWLIIDLNHRIGLRQPCLSSPQRLRPGLVRCWAAVLHRAEYGMNSWDLTQQLRMRGQSSACANKQPEGSENEEKRSLFFWARRHFPGHLFTDHLCFFVHVMWETWTQKSPWPIMAQAMELNWTIYIDLSTLVPGNHFQENASNAQNWIGVDRPD